VPEALIGDAGYGLGAVIHLRAIRDIFAVVYRSEN
jgi:hypothetical protein